MNMKKMLALVLALAMLACMLTGCGSTAAGSAAQASSASAAVEQTAAPASEAPAASTAEEPAEEAAQSILEGSAAEAGAEAAAAADGAQLAVTEPVAGSPWNDTQIIGNLPEEKPEADDDFYTYADYEFLEANQEAENDLLVNAPGSYAEQVLTSIMTEQNPSALMDQIRILFSQCMDVDTQVAQGVDEVLPYLDQIDNCATLDDLSALLADESFPFNPFLTLSVSPYGMNGTNMVSVDTNFLFTDSLSEGGLVYHDTGVTADPSTWSDLLMSTANDVVNIMAAFLDPTIVQQAVPEMVAFESEYGQYAYYNGMSQQIEYGTAGDYNSVLSLDELAELAGSFPIREIMAKYGIENSDGYLITCSDWLKTLGSLYTEDNLELLKAMVAGKVCYEAASVLHYGYASTAYQLSGEEMPAATDEEAVSYAYNLMFKPNVLSNQLGSLYLSSIISADDQARLNTMVENVRDSYAQMIQDCGWIDDTTRGYIMEKLDTLRMNVLQPEGGYDDYSDLQLVASEDGGTLFSNYLLLKDYNWQKQAARLGEAADSSTVWYMYGASLPNAMYDPSTNAINILPGFLSSATYSTEMTDTEMYAALGSVVGHEISHGFDVGGSQYDADGLPNIIFSEDDKAEYQEKVAALEDYFSTITIEEGVNVDGNFVSLEATADLCGFRAALNAIEALEPQLDYTDFFETYANMWGKSASEATVVSEVMGDSHNQNYVRVNVDCQMIAEFYDTYDVEEGDGMYLSEDQRLTFWW